MMEPLFRELRRLVAALAPHGIPVVIGGGYGLLLRQRRVEESEAETLLDLPPDRTTLDLDVFLNVEVLADVEKAEAVKEALRRLGYQVIRGRESYQFTLDTGDPGFDRGIKIDLLSAVPRDMAEYPTLRHEMTGQGHPKLKNRRVRGINAFAAPEAFSVEEGMEPVDLGMPDGGVESDVGGSLKAYIPHPFTYLILKLHAYRDKQDNTEKDYRYHAFDLYRILAMTTPDRVEEIEGMRDRHTGHPVMAEAGRIVAGLFTDADAKGTLALRGYAQDYGDALGETDVETFLRALTDFIPPGPNSPPSSDD